MGVIKNVKKLLYLFSFYWKHAKSYFIITLLLELLIVPSSTFFNLNIIRVAVDGIANGESFAYIFRLICFYLLMIFFLKTLHDIYTHYSAPINAKIVDEIKRNPCQKIYFCNAMSQPGETDDFSVEDHIRAIEKHSFKNAVDLAIVNDSYIPQNILEAYAKQGSYPVKIKEHEHSYRIIVRKLIMFDEKGRIRHNPDAVKKVIEEVIQTI